MKPSFKKGDWICSECNNHNFAKRTECNRCRKIKEVSIPNWNCTICKEINFGNHLECANCKTTKDGRYCDWICHKCWNINDRRKANCSTVGCNQIYSNQSMPNISIQDHNIDNVLNVYSNLGVLLQFDNLSEYSKNDAIDILSRKYISIFELLNKSIPRILKNQNPDTGHHSDCCLL